jgi:hypothetical protein
VTPDQFRAARAALGKQRGLGRPLTGKEMAEALRMGKHGWQTISGWETGKTPIPGPVQVAIELMLERQVVDTRRDLR